MKRLFLVFTLAVGLFAQKPGYNPPAPTLNTRIPQLQLICNALQWQLDARYLHGPGGVDNWYAQVETWTNANVLARSQSADPERYGPTPWTMQVPVRTIADYDDEGIPTYRSETDPAIKPPVLPPYVKAPPPNTGPGFVTKAPQVEQAEAAEKAAMFGLLLDIQKSLAAIKAKLGI